jgi:hypothetical protein
MFVRRPPRRALGSTHPHAKLTEQDVREIRIAADRGEVYLDIANRYGVNNRNISQIAQRKTWRHVDDGIECAPRRCRGEQRGKVAKLMEQQVREIRAAAAEGVLHKDLAAQYGVSRSAVGLLVKRKTWSHVEDILQ